jgi:hypothetical protein
MKRQTRKLALARETLRRLEDESLGKVLGHVGHPTNKDSICLCITDLCVSDGYTGCVACEM